MSKSEIRKKSEMILVRATPEEKQALKERADAFGMSMGELCRRTIFSSKPPKSILDQSAIQELARLRADLGRIGGLLKGWLAGSFPAGAPLPQELPRVRELLSDIEQKQRQITGPLIRAFGKQNNDQ